MSLVTLSIVMPVYNAERFLAMAIESILNQSYSDFEFIIVNDGSTDDSVAIINHYLKLDSRIKFVNRQENKKLAFTLNEGISLATGKYIARMDADDTSDRLRFEKQISLIQETNADIVGCSYYIIDEKSCLIDINIKPESDELMKMNLLFGTPFAHGSVLIKKEFLIANNLNYSDSPIEDLELWYQIYLKGGRFANTYECLFSYRKFNGSFSDKKRKEMSKARYALLKDTLFKKEEAFKSLFIESLDNKKFYTKFEKKYIFMSACVYFMYSFNILVFFRIFLRFFSLNSLYHSYFIVKDYIKHNVLLT
jgi:glycosyltransferase involved in cell wall biosynthesis